MDHAILRQIHEKLEAQKALYLVLLDPDSFTPDKNGDLAALAAQGGADIILIGGSLSMGGEIGETVRRVKEASALPVVIFPGDLGFVVPEADAVLFLSLVSGRNPQLLIGEHVKAAPIMRKMGLEAIPTAYMLVEGGATTSVEFMSGTRALPRNKPDIAMAHALAAQYLGMQIAFMDAGSGAESHVPTEMVQAVAGYVDIPVMVGGGIRTPEAAAKLVEAGARLVVTGDVVERSRDLELVSELAAAIHG